MLRGNPGWTHIAGSAGLSATLFFLAGNLEVWASPGTWYPQTWAGLMECYAAGLPSYRNDFLATIIVVGAAFASSLGGVDAVGAAWQV